MDCRGRHYLVELRRVAVYVMQHSGFLDPAACGVGGGYGLAATAATKCSTYGIGAGRAAGDRRRLYHSQLHRCRVAVNEGLKQWRP